MKSKTKNSIIILSIVAILVLTTVVYFKLLLDKNIAYIIETKKNNFLLAEKIHNASDLKRKSSEIEQILKSFNVFYIDRNNIVSFIKIIEKAANDNGVSLVIDNVSVDESHLTESLPYGILSMSLIASGKLNSTTNFLSSLEKLPYHLDFGAVKLVTKDDEKSSDWSINIAITGITN
jgi:Tfp pilus assembly protein PilO